MSATSALLGALLTSLWQVTLCAVAFAVVRQVVGGPLARHAAALVTLGAQLAWPLATLAQLLQVRLTLFSPTRVETSGQWVWVPLLWAVGTLVMVTRTAGGLALVRAWVARAAPVTGPVLDQLEALRSRLGVRPVRWAASARLVVPMTVGALRPVVLLPLALVTALPAQDLELLAAHELMHVRRWDYLANLGQAVVEACLFFHPAMWWVSRCAREEREYCCDDAVVAHLGRPRSYARALLSLEESRSPVGLAVSSTGGQFMHRIRRILGSRQSTSWSFAVPMVGLAVVALGLGACAARNVRGDIPIVAASAELVPSLRTLCDDLRTEQQRPEVASVDPADRLTLVLTSLGERNPRFEAFLSEVARAPVPQRRESFKQSVSAALGSAWQCAEFDALWSAPETATK